MVTRPHLKRILLVQCAMVELEAGRQAFATPAGLPVLIGPIKLFPANHDIQRLGCSVLLSISAEQEARALICEHGALGVLMDTLKHHTETAVLLPAMNTLLVLSEEDAVKKKLSEDGAVRDLLQARQNAPVEESDLRRSLAATLANLACLQDLDQHKADFLECGGVDCLMDVLLLHAADVDMQIRVTSALWELLLLEAGRIQLLEMQSAVESIIASMTQRPTVMKLQLACCGILNQLSKVLRPLVSALLTHVYA